MRNTRSAALCVAAAVALCAAVVLCAGCAVGPDFHAPAPPRAASYGPDAAHATAASAGPAGQAQRFLAGEDLPARWWQAFDSPEIDALVRQTLSANPDLQAARAALRAAQQTVAAQRGAYFPQLGLGVDAARRQDPRTLSPTLASSAQRFSLYTAQLALTYPLDLFGANRRQVESLQAAADAQRFEVEATYLTLVADTVVAAINQAAAQSELDLNARIVAGEQQSLDILRRQYRLGAVSSTDVSAQEAALAQAQALLPALQAQRTQQHDLLAALTGQLPGELAAGRLDLAALTLPQRLPLSLPARLVVQRPDVRVAQAELHAATAQVGVAVANLLPNIALSADGGSAAVSLAHLVSPATAFWSLGGSLSQTLFAGGTLEHRRRAAVAAMDQAGAEYRSAVLQAFRQVGDALASLQSDAAVLQAQTRAADTAARTLASTRHDLQLGAASYLALLDAQRSYDQAALAQLAARAARLSDTVLLFQALGGGWWRADAPAVTRTTR
jgi:NodT family efflux transporter outer membrane factor (OMF) lipoprotein